MKNALHISTAKNHLRNEERGTLKMAGIASFFPMPAKPSTLQCVGISACGTFGVLKRLSVSLFVVLEIPSQAPVILIMICVREC